MENNNSYDWLAVKDQASDKSFADIYSLGVSPTDTTLQSKDFYKKSDKIQQQFKKQDGTFDNAGFDAYYLDAEKSLNEYKKSNFDLGNGSMDLWEDTSVARAIKAPIRKNPVKLSLTSRDPFTNLKTAQGSFLGLQEINKWSSPTKTLSEVAQGQKVVDGISGKSLDYTPEDTGLLNMYGFFNEPLVMAQYDKDVKDEKGKVINKKGDYKFDEQGLPFYETLSGRNLSGKQQLSRWNTLTKEGSFANKFDFMDSDGFDKSMTGLVVKSAVQLLPFALGGPVASAFKAYYIAQGLLEGGAEIAKSIDGIMNGPNAAKGGTYKFLNSLQGYTGNFKSGLSEYGQQNFMSLESLTGMAVDSVYQLMGQEALGRWPLEVKKYQMAKALSLKPASMVDIGEEATKGLFSLEAYVAKYGLEEGKAVMALSKNVAALEKYGKYSTSAATAYMAATSAVGISQVSDEANLDARDKGFLYLGYMASLIPLFNSEVGGWVHKGLDVDNLSKGINTATKDYAQRYFPKILAEAEQKIPGTTLKGRAVSIMAAGRELGKNVASFAKNFSVNGMGTAALAEGTEEVTEQMLQNALQGIYNGLSSAGIRSTEEDAQFNLNGGDIAKDYLQNFVGGALGGAVFHKIRPHHENVFQSESMKEYVTEGYGGQVIKKIQDLQKSGELGDKTLSTVPLTDEDGNVVPKMWKPVNADNPISQNDFIADRMIKEVRVNEAQRKGFNIMNPNDTAEGKNKFYQALVDTKTDTDLRDRIHLTASKIYDLANQISDITDLDGETDEGMLEKKGEMKLLQKELEYLQSDESVDEYFRQGLFNIRTDINSKFGVKTRQSITEDLIGKRKKYNGLNEDDKRTVDTAYEEYRQAPQFGIKDDLKAGFAEYERFQENMEGGGYKDIEAFKQSIIDLEKYGSGILIKDYGDVKPIVLDAVRDPFQETIDGLRGVKYVPDYMWDQISAKLKTITSDGALPYIDTMISGNLSSFKAAIENGLKTVEVSKNSPLVSGFIDKQLGGKFNEILATPEFKDLFDNKQNASNYSLLKTLKSIAEATLRDDQKITDYRAFTNEVNSLDNEDILNLINGTVGDIEHPILDYLKKNKFSDLIDQLTSPSFGLTLNEIVTESMGAKNLLNKFAKTNLMSEKSGVDIDAPNMFGYLTEPTRPNLIVDLLLDGNFNNNGEVITASALNAADTSTLDANVEFAKNFDQERVSSPLRKMLKSTYEFMESEFQNLDMVGYSNYLNSDEGFSDAIQAHINAVERLGAMINAADELNPLINDFRKNHTTILPETLRGIELFELSPQDSGTLNYETSQLSAKLKHLQDVNEYNKNNILARLLKEDGLILASNVKTWQDISNSEAVMNLLPAIADLYAPDSNIVTYAANPNIANDDDKFSALRDMAKFEHNIFMQFQGLSTEDKKTVINLTFAPIEPTSEDFSAKITGDEKLTDSQKTIYLAKTFGTSSMQFASDVSGNYDETTGKFDKIEAALNTPFPVQDSAIRLAYFLRNSDPYVKKALFNAYTYGASDQVGIDYTVPGSTSLVTDSMISIWGDPGTGKTTAVIAGIIATLPESVGDVVLLAPKARQLSSLKGSLVKAGYEGRINTDSSLLVNDFLQSLGLQNKAGRSYDFTNNTNRMAEILNGDKSNEIRGTDSLQVKVDKMSGAMAKLVSDMFKEINLYDSKSETQGTFKDNIVAKLSPFKLIVVDEFTHINPLDLALLSELITKYNATTTVLNNLEKQITLVTAGDIHQMGYSQNGSSRNMLHYMAAITSTPLTTSLRSGWDLINNTLIDVKRRTYAVNNAKDTELSNTDFLSQFKEPIRLTYAITPELGSVGIRTVNKVDGATTVDDIKFITDNKDKLANGSLVYVVNDESKITEAETLLKAALGDNWRSKADINVYTPDEVQGGEYNYAIIDAAPALSNSPYDIKRVHEFLNTMLSRGTEATLFVNNGVIDPFVTLENVTKDTAINQKRLTQDIIDEIKSNKNVLMRAILEKFAPEEVPTTPDETSPEPPDAAKTDQSVPTPAPVPKTTAVVKPVAVEPVPPKMQTVKVSTLSKIFNDKQLTDRGMVNIPGMAANGEAASNSNSTDVMAYTTFSTAKDFDTIENIMYKANNAIPSNVEIEKVISSYKSYLNNRGSLTEGNLTLKTNFVDYFDSYDYTNPVYYIEASRRGEEGMTKGRSNITDYKQAPEDIILSLKVRIPSMEGGSDITLTMGMLNNINSIKKKHLQLKQKSGDISDNIVNWATALTGFINGDERAPSVGITEGKTWRSFDFDQTQLDDMSNIFGARIIYAPNTNVSYQEVRDTYSDFYMTNPQVVVASNLNNDIGAAVANKGGNNSNYADIWQKLKGKSVAFITDMYALKGKSPQEMLDIYFKQLELFNTDEFLNLSPKEKELRVEENLRNGINIKLDNQPNTANVIPYKPGMVKLVKLDNPKAAFLEFREYFLAELQKSRVNKHENPQEGFKQFDMPVYVKDRLVKSLMVIHKFLQMDENRKWFTENVINQSGKNVEDRVQRARDFIAQEWGDPDFADKIEVDDISARGVNSMKLHGMSKMDASQFAGELSQLLYNKENNLIRGLYLTDDNKVKDSDLQTDFKDKDLDFTLSKNKQNDFSGNILSVNAFQLFLKTKNLTFTELIDLSLTAFGNLPLDGDMGKYSLKEVFPEGKVESVVVAANNINTSNIKYASNFLAEASQYSNGFTFNFGGLQTPAYNMDFNKLYKFFEGEVKDDRVEIQIATEDKFDALVSKFKGMENTDLFKSLLDSRFNVTTEQQVETLAESIGEFDIDSPAFRTNIKEQLKPGDIVAYTGDADGLKGKITLQDFVTHNLKGMLPGYDFDTAKFNLTSSSMNEASFTVLTDTAEFKVDFNLANKEVQTTQIAAVMPEVNANEEGQNKMNPMDNIKKIEKAELKKFDDFVESEFSPELREIDVVKDYIDMYKEFYRHTVVSANIAGTEFTMSDYDADLANMDLDVWNRSKNQFLNKNEDILAGANTALRKMSKLIKQYKPNC